MPGGDGLRSVRLVACGSESGQQHCRDAKLLQCDQLPSGLVQDCQWKTKAVQKVVHSLEGEWSPTSPELVSAALTTNTTAHALGEYSQLLSTCISNARV